MVGRVLSVHPTSQATEIVHDPKPSTYSIKELNFKTTVNVVAFEACSKRIKGEIFPSFLFCQSIRLAKTVDVKKRVRGGLTTRRRSRMARTSDGRVVVNAKRRCESSSRDDSAARLAAP
jgi:hypothetical protein